jgi:hypothetical protein
MDIEAEMEYEFQAGNPKSRGDSFDNPNGSEEAGSLNEENKR